MVLARNSITLTHMRDVADVTRYYKLQASTASAPASAEDEPAQATSDAVSRIPDTTAPN